MMSASSIHTDGQVVGRGSPLLYAALPVAGHPAHLQVGARGHADRPLAPTLERGRSVCRGGAVMCQTVRRRLSRRYKAVIMDP